MMRRRKRLETEDGDAMEVLPCHSGCHALQHARAHPRPGPQGVGHQDRAEAEAGLPMMRVATILRGAAPGAGLGAGLHLLAEALGEGATRVSKLQKRKIIPYFPHFFPANLIDYWPIFFLLIIFKTQPQT